MASGHYEIKWVYDARWGDYVQKKVWVPAPAPKPSTVKKTAAQAAIERQRAAEEARRKADAAAARAAATRAAEAKRLAEERAAQEAARRAEQLRLADQRRLAYERLIEERDALLRRAQLVKETIKKPVPPPKPRSVVLDRAERLAEQQYLTRRGSEFAKRQAAAAQAAKAARIQAAERTRWAEYGYYWKKRLAVTGSKSDPKTLEEIIREEEKRAGEGRSDPKFVAAITQRYVGYSEQIAAKHRKLVDQINDYIDAGNVAAARRLYEGEFRTVLAEYNRLFGDGSDPRKEGALAAFFKSYGNIELAQQEWWKRQMQRTLDADRSEVNRRLKAALARGDTEEIRELQELQRIYAGKTGIVQTVDENGRIIRRRRTIEEELDYREAKRRVEMERLRAAMEVDRRRRQAMLRAEGLVEGPGGMLLTREQRPVVERMQRLVKERYGGKPPSIDRQEELNRWADEVMADWDRDNPQPPVRPRERSGPRYEAWKVWKQRRDAYERAIYDFYGSQAPGMLDRLFQVPGVSHALATLQGGVSAIGTGGRIVLKATTGSSKVDFGFHSSDLPENVRRMIEKQAGERVAEIARQQFRSGSAATRFNPEPVRQRVLGELYVEWLRTEAGRRWVEERRARWSAEDKAFLDALYGGGTDPGSVAGRLFSGTGLDALNQFGSSPTTNAGADLLFQLLADPTNAIPLKFTTYLARGKFAAEMAGKTKFLGSTKAGRIRDFVKVDEGTLKLRKELDKLLKRGGQDGKSAAQLTDELLLEVAGITDKSGREAAIQKKLVQAGLSPRLVNDTQLFNLTEEAIKARLRREGVDYASQSDEIRKRIEETEKAQKAATEARQARQVEREARRKLGRQKRLQASEEARKRLAAGKASQERQLAAEVAAQKKTGAGVGAPPASGAAQGATGQPPAPAVTRVAGMRVPEAKPRSETAKKVIPMVQAKPKRTVSEVRRIRHAEEYYKPDAMGNWLPKDSQVMKDPRYRRLAEAARGGDAVAQEQLARLARQRRNIARMEAEDLKRSSPFVQTDLDLVERAGAAHDGEAAARLLTDRETVRHLKRTLQAAKKKGKSANLYVSEFAMDRGHTIRRDFDLDRAPSADRIDIGDDLISAADESPRGLHDAYEVFSGLDNRTQHYKGGIYSKVRSATWRKSLGEKRFGQFIEALDSEVMGAGVAGFRDGGQALFELFHRLRLAKDFKKLERLSSFVDAILRDLEDPFESLFAWQWKVMEERAGLPWAWNWETVEDGFMQAAERWNMHPNLALAMIPNGFYAHRAPNRFRLSSALLGIQDSAIFRAAPGTWTESDALKAITQTFTRGTQFNATRIVHYTAERFGSFAKGFKLRNRILDELTHAVRNEMGAEELARILEDRAELLPEAITQRGTRETIIRELTKSHGVFADGRPKRPDYAPLRAAVQESYWRGELGLPNPEAHKLMLLAHLQDNPKSWVAATNVFVDYMTELGQIGEAKRFLRELFRDRIDNLGSRFAAERLNGVEKSVDPVTGEVIEIGLTEEWKLWDQLGFTPDVDRVKAWLDNVQRGDRVAVDRADARKLRELGQFDTEEDLLRDLAARHERDTSSLTYAGTVDTDWLLDTIDARVAEFRVLKDKNPKAAQAKLFAAGKTLERAVVRVIDEGATGAEFDAMQDVARRLAAIPEGKAIIDALRDSIGDEALARWLNLSGNLPQYRLPVPKKRAAQPLREGELPKPSREAVRRAAAREPQPDNAPVPAVEPEPELVPDVVPEQTAPMSEAEALLEAIGGMTEEQWWKFIGDKSWRVLKSPKASPRAKLAARRVLKDIEAAKFAKRTARSRGTYIPPKERARFRNRVLALHGKDAEELIAPKLIAPYVEDAQGLAVEQTRTYWRTLRAASPKDVPSRVKGITKNGRAIDYMPYRVWNRLEQKVADSIAEARKFRADTRTRARRAGRLEDSQRPLGKLSDSDPRVIAAKEKALREFAQETGYAVSMNAYDEARKVLWKGHVQNRSANWLMNRANEIVARFGGEYREVYKRLREKEARAEARRQLSQLAWREMHGHAPDEVMAEFVARYTDDGQLRSFTPELTAFQRRTLEEHVKHLSGVTDLDDHVQMSAWLSSRNAPPRNSREASREFLTEIGAWSPRKAEQFVKGAESWSVQAEADYWRTNYGFVPDWADAQKLGTEFSEIFHDQEVYYAQMRAWGIFNRSAESRLRLSGETAQEIEERVLKGDPALGVKGKRELDLQRKYVIERYGPLVADGDRLIAMPWLMYPDELKDYFVARSGAPIADDLIQNADELHEVQNLIADAVVDFWDKYIAPAAKEGPVQYEDIFRMASEIQARLLANPKWARRYRDVFGSALNAWATVQRAMVFTQASFMVANVVDAPIKSAWYRFTRRGLFNPQLAQASPDLARRAEALTARDLGLDVQTTLYRLKQRPLREAWKNPLARTQRGRWLERAVTIPKAGYRFFPEQAAKAEIAMKMRLAQGMYPQVYSEALARLGNEELTDAFAKKFIKDEVSRMWPTVGDHPLEKLFNQLVPFGSYMVKNRVLYISEAIAHPAILNQIEFVGRFIEQHNRRNWEREHPGEPLPDWAARRIELPWAPGYFLDLGQFSDATRGLKPIYSATGPQTYMDFAAQFIRIVNPGTQAGIYMLTNALGVTQRIQWQPVLDANGFVKGYEKVITGWTEPWSNEEPTLGSVFWVLEAVQEAEKLGAGGWTNGELSQLIGKLTMFDAIRGVDRGAGLFEYYKALREKDKAFAALWLAETENGKYLQEWLYAKSSDLQDVADRFSLAHRWDVDPARWFHTQSPEFQQKVKDARARMDKIREAYEDKLYGMTPGTNEYRETKAEMMFYISEVYRLVPELVVADVYSKSASEWSKQLDKWQTSKLMDEFFALDGQRPKRADFESSAEYNKALDAWKHQKEVFLKTYPQVEAMLGNARDELDRVRDRVDKEWDEVLTRIGKRNEAIEAAKAAGDDEKADLLYLQNELDFSILERDHVAMYFTENDFQRLPKGVLGPANLIEGALKKATVLLDFDRVRFEKAKREGREQQFLDDLAYARGLKEVILKAKGGSEFGKFNPATFVTELKKRPKLLALYFAKNPGKEAQWRQTDQYIALIGKWGRAARAGRWDEAERLWNALPQWVKDRYYAKHPERRKKAAETAAYVGYMKRWVAYFERDDVKGGMDFFWSMPAWVRERYFKKHPEKRTKWEADLKHGKELAEYFAADKEARADYLAKHPALKKWLAENVSDEERERQAILAGYRAIPKDDQWLRRVYREKHPEVFSKEAQGERRLKKVYDRLASHPEMLPSFEKWVEAIWKSYAEMLKHSGTRPREVTLDRSIAGRRTRRSLSADEVANG